MPIRSSLAVLTVGIAIVLADPASAALPTELDLSKRGSVTFLAVGSPSMLKIRGELKETGGTPGLDGKLTVEGNMLKGSATARLDGFDTGIGLRNEHMKNKYLETGKFPTAEVTLEPVTLPDGVAQGGAGSFPFQGKLTLHGTTKPIAGTVVASGNALKFEFPVALAEHGVDIPSYLGVKVTKDVTVTVDVNTSAVAVP